MFDKPSTNFFSCIGSLKGRKWPKLLKLIFPQNCQLDAHHQGLTRQCNIFRRFLKIDLRLCIFVRNPEKLMLPRKAESIIGVDILRKRFKIRFKTLLSFIILNHLQKLIKTYCNRAKNTPVLTGRLVAEFCRQAEKLRL